ncbi:Crp/Fnr family transcriptional regulator [Methylobacterium phyllostachyos]|nr:Crp/Fnr family transcriptional regulator [Methylobacterium phyllostachyos]
MAGLPMQVSAYEPHQDVVVENDRPARCFTVLDGIAAAYKTTNEGGRQVTAFYVPGDVPGFQCLQLEVLDFSIAAVTTLRIGSVGHDAVRGMLAAHPRLADAFWRTTLIEGSLAREWLLNNGRREAYGRLAHLFCELLTRLEAVDLAHGRACDFRLTQSELADALGVTAVHVNRVLKELRDQGLITLGGGRLVIHDWDALAEAADFDPAYLHLRRDDARTDAAVIGPGGHRGAREPSPSKPAPGPTWPLPVPVAATSGTGPRTQPDRPRPRPA